MVVVRLGPAFRRWLVVCCAGALVVGLMRWGFRGAGDDLGLIQAGQVFSELPVNEQVLALTFDASGASTDLADVLSAVVQAGLPATFLVSGQYIAAHGAIARSAVAAGDEVETVGWTGTDLTRLQGQALIDDVRRGAQAVEQATGLAPLFLAPPLGHYDPAVLKAARTQGLAVATGTSPAGVGTSAAVAKAAVAAARPGAVLRLPASALVAAAVPAIASELTTDGYEPVTLEALLAFSQGAADISLESTP